MEFRDSLVECEKLIAESLEELNETFKTRKNARSTDSGVQAGFTLGNYIRGLKEIQEAGETVRSLRIMTEPVYQEEE